MEEKKDIVATPRTELTEAVIQLLERQGEKFNSSEVLGLLSLCNLLGIISFLSRDTGHTHPGLAAVAGLAQNLAGQQGDGKGLDLQGLLNTLLGMVGGQGNQKLNPATLLTLISLLNGGQKKQPVQEETPALPPQRAEKPQPVESPPRHDTYHPGDS